MLDPKIGFKDFSSHHAIHLKKTDISFKEFLLISLIVFLELFAITTIFSFGLSQILSISLTKK
jgi:hypothetical protein